MKVFTDRPIYSYADGTVKKGRKKNREIPVSATAPLQSSTETQTSYLSYLDPFNNSREEIMGFQEWVIKRKRDSKILGISTPNGVWGENSQTAWLKYGEEYKQVQQKQKNRQTKELERNLKKSQRKDIRQEKRATRKANRLAKRLLRAKDKTGRKRWFYPISRVFKGKKKQADGTIVDVNPNNVVTTSSGAQFDKTDIAKATGVSPESVTSQTAEQILVSNNQGGATISENTTLSPFVARREETAINSNATAEEVLRSITTVYAPVNESKEIVEGTDGGMYMSDETTSQEEPPISDEEFNAMKKNSEEPKKGLGVWGWVGVSAIVVGLGIGAVLLYKMSKGKK